MTERRFRLIFGAVDRATLLTLTASLGLAFRRRGMAAHAQKLRAFYAVARAGALDREQSVDLRWSEALTVEWLKVLQVPPYDKTYRAQSRMAPCPECKSKDREVQTMMNFPDGFLAACRCGTKWLVMER